MKVQVLPLRALAVFVPTGMLVVVAALFFLQQRWPPGVWVFGLGVFVVLVSVSFRLSVRTLVPDLVFGAIDTGLLTVFALTGGVAYGVVGAIVGGVVGDSVTDGIAGFFEGGISQWLERHGFDASRTPLGTSMGKMGGCLLGCGIALTCAWFVGINVFDIVAQ
jgi:hypothetical protein